LSSATKFSAREILPFIARAHLGEAVCVVGGQALNLWSEVFASELGKHQPVEPLTSKDLDFFGSSADARKLAQELSGALFLPGFDDQTASTGLVVLQVGGNTLEVDFLDSLLGVRSADVLKCSLVLRFSLVADAGPTSVPVRIMHPVHCLQSRATNLVHPATRRSSNSAKAQYLVAHRIAALWIRRALRDGEHREVIDSLTMLGRFLTSDPYGRTLHFSLKPDPLTVLKLARRYKALDERYRTITLAKLIARIERRRAVLAKARRAKES
jgi:hypothetical protein